MTHLLMGIIPAALLKTLFLDPVLFAPVKLWWGRQREGKERQLLLDDEMRWQEKGRETLLLIPYEPPWKASAIQVHRVWEDHCRAWYRQLARRPYPPAGP